MISIKEAFAKAEILNDVSPSTIAELASCARMIKKQKGEHLFYDKEEVSQIYIVAEGLAALYKMNSIGEKKVIFVYGKGKMLNEVMLYELPASINCEILQDSYILAFPKKRFEAILMQDGQLSKAVIESMSLKIRRLYRQLKNTTNALRGDKRVAAKLWKLAHDYGVKEEEGVRIDMELTITYLAEMLGSKRETVSKQIKALAAEQLVLYKKNHFFIPDCEKLRNYFKAP